MQSGPDIGIGREAFDRLAGDSLRRWSAALAATDPQGRVVFAGVADAWGDSPRELGERRLALQEALRWGEPTIHLCEHKRVIWAVPLMRNAQLLGGLVAGVPEPAVFPEGAGQAALDVRGACAELRRWAEEANLTNAALLASRREESRREQKRAEALHEFKLHDHYNIRELYLRDEPDLIAAVRKNDRGAAREILNRLLVAIHHYAGQRMDLIKSFFMELVATMCRTAVEAGGDPQELLGTNFASMTDLSRLTSMEALAPWLHEMLERVMECIHRHRAQTNTVLLTAAMEHIGEHFAEDISRDDVARIAHMSPSHFSRLVRKQTGKSFTELLNKTRVSHAADLLRRTDRSLVLIAMEAGFRDQSYFTKVFRRHTGLTPRQYRQNYLS